MNEHRDNNETVPRYFNNNNCMRFCILPCYPYTYDRQNIVRKRGMVS